LGAVKVTFGFVLSTEDVVWIILGFRPILYMRNLTLLLQKN